MRSRQAITILCTAKSSFQCRVSTVWLYITNWPKKIKPIDPKFLMLDDFLFYGEFPIFFINYKHNFPRQFGLLSKNPVCQQFLLFQSVNGPEKWSHKFAVKQKQMAVKFLKNFPRLFQEFQSEIRYKKQMASIFPLCVFSLYRDLAILL